MSEKEPELCRYCCYLATHYLDILDIRYEEVDVQSNLYRQYQLIQKYEMQFYCNTCKPEGARSIDMPPLPRKFLTNDLRSSFSSE